MFDKLPIVFVQGMGRTGFDLLRTLLDGHKEILILPFTDKFTTIWQKNNFSSDTHLDEIVDVYLYNSKIYRFKEQTISELDIIHDYDMVDWKIYEESFKKFIREHYVSSRYVRLAIYYAFAKSINKNINSLKTIIADAFYSDQTDFILNDFPNARFIHLLKDHRGNFLSLKAYYHRVNGTLYPIKGDIKNFYFHILFDYMFPTMKMLHKNKLKLKDDLKVLKYENLLTKTKLTMKELSYWLNINYNDDLLITTRIGKTTKSNSAFNEIGVTGINPEFADRWENELESYEIRMIEFFFKKSLEDLGYKVKYAMTKKNYFLGFLSCLLPIRGEIIPNKRILKKTNQGKNRYLIWRLTKFLIFLCNNIFCYIRSRIKLFFLINKLEYKVFR